jgi:cytochrome c oxidase cbb3-type subunit 2
MQRNYRRSLIGTVASVSITCVGAFYAHADVDTVLAEKGKQVYARYCVVCHGAQGDGKGLTGVIHRAQANGVVVTTYPRNFTHGVFKFRSTPTGSLPRDEDLLHTVTTGIPRSGMPSHKDVPTEDRRAVIEYIKTFSGAWDGDAAPDPISLPPKPEYVGSKDSIERGKGLWSDMGCYKCHGLTGRGNGPSSDTLVDNWNEKVLPFDFTSGPLKGGGGAEGIYRTFMTGLDGTPMPSFDEIMTEQQRWDLVSYCLELMKGESTDVAQR